MTGYLPTNGTEGLGFIECWCSRCARDENEDCEILAASFRGPVKQWVCDQDGPLCTAFKPAAEAERCDETADLFGEDR